VPELEFLHSRSSIISPDVRKIPDNVRRRRPYLSFQPEALGYRAGRAGFPSMSQSCSRYGCRRDKWHWLRPPGHSCFEIVEIEVRDTYLTNVVVGVVQFEMEIFQLGVGRELQQELTNCVMRELNDFALFVNHHKVLAP